MDAAQRTRHGRLEDAGGAADLCCPGHSFVPVHLLRRFAQRAQRDYGELIEPQRTMPAMDRYQALDGWPTVRWWISRGSGFS